MGCPLERTHPFSFRVSEEVREAIRSAAAKSRLSDSEWVRLVVEAAAGVSDLSEHLARAKQFGAGKVRDGKW